MSAHANATVSSGNLAEPPAAEGLTAEQATPCFREACCLEVPIRVFGSRAIAGLNGDILKGDPFEEESVTMLLFPRGAVIRLAAPVAPEHDVMMIDLRTNRYAHCRIMKVRNSPEVKSYVEVEFTHVASGFWSVSPSRERAHTAGARPAAELPWVPPEEPVRAPEATPPKAQAAAAGVDAAKPGIWPGYAVDRPAPKAACSPSVPADERENLAEAPFFAPMPTAAIPMSEPVLDQAEESAPPLPQTTKWEAVSKREPRRKGRRRAAVGAVIISAIFFGYRLAAPVEPALPTAIESVSTTSVEVLPPGIAETAAAVKAGLTNKDWASGSTTAAPNPIQPAGSSAGATRTAAPANVTTAIAFVPEVTPVQKPKRLVVLSSKMNLPIEQTSLTRHDAPELSAAGSAGQTTEAPRLPGATPGGAAGLLAGKSTAPPPPPEPAPAADNPGKTDEPLTPARLITSAPPDYPPLAKRAHIEGDVTVFVQLDASGNVLGTKALSGPQVLRDAAVKSVAKWKFEPARQGKQPTASATTVTLRFRLD